MATEETRGLDQITQIACDNCVWTPLDYVGITVCLLKLCTNHTARARQTAKYSRYLPERLSSV